jgi:hypothetical protein
MVSLRAIEARMKASVSLRLEPFESPPGYHFALRATALLLNT